MDSSKDAFFKYTPIRQITQKFFIDERTVNELASTTIIPYVSSRFRVRKEQQEKKLSGKKSGGNSSLACRIIFNRSQTIIRKNYGFQFMARLKAILFYEKMLACVRRKQCELVESSFRMMLRKSKVKNWKQGFERMERFLFKKKVVLKAKGYKQIQIRSLFLNMKGKSKQFPLQSEKTIRKQKVLLQHSSPRIPKPFQVQQLYKNIDLSQKFWSFRS